MLNSLAKLVAKKSMKIRGGGHFATKTNGLNGLNEVKKPTKKSKEKGQTFLLHRISDRMLILQVPVCFVL